MYFTQEENSGEESDDSLKANEPINVVDNGLNQHCPIPKPVACAFPTELLGLLFLIVIHSRSALKALKKLLKHRNLH